MTFQFNGDTFANRNQFSAAYPAYRNYADLVAGGISTILDLEKAITQRAAEARKVQVKQARKNNKGWTVKTKRGAR